MKQKFTLVHRLFKVNLDFFPLEDLGTRKIPLLWTVCDNTALTAWQVAMLPASAHQSQYKMASDFVTHVE
jgi:hypothetical protein